MRWLVSRFHSNHGVIQDPPKIKGKWVRHSWDLGYSDGSKRPVGFVLYVQDYCRPLRYICIYFDKTKLVRVEMSFLRSLENCRWLVGFVFNVQSNLHWYFSWPTNSRGNLGRVPCTRFPRCLWHCQSDSFLIFKLHILLFIEWTVWFPGLL